MAITDYQAKYLAYELTRQAPSNSMEKLAVAVAGAQVDLNPPSPNWSSVISSSRSGRGTSGTLAIGWCARSSATRLPCTSMPSKATPLRLALLT